MRTRLPAWARATTVVAAAALVLGACASAAPTQSAGAPGAGATGAGATAAGAATSAAGATAAGETAAGATSAAAGSPAGGVTSGKSYRIAMVSPLNHALFEQERRGAELAAKLTGSTLEFTTMSDEFTMENYINFIKPVIATKPDAIAFGFYSDGFAPLMEDAAAAGVLPVFVNGTPRNNPETKFPQYQQTGSAGPDEFAQSGALAFSFVNTINKPGKIAVINNFPGSPDHQLRIDGGTAIFTKNGYTTEVLAGSMDDATALSNVSAFLSANPDVVGVYTTGSTSAIAACQYMKQSNLSIPVATFDATEDTIGLVKEGCVTNLVDQQFFLEGFYAVMNAWTALERGVVPVHINTGTYLITKENVGSYKEQ